MKMFCFFSKHSPVLCISISRPCLQRLLLYFLLVGDFAFPHSFHIKLEFFCKGELPLLCHLFNCLFKSLCIHEYLFYSKDQTPILSTYGLQFMNFIEQIISVLAIGSSFRSALCPLDMFLSFSNTSLFLAPQISDSFGIFPDSILKSTASP